MTNKSQNSNSKSIARIHHQASWHCRSFESWDLALIWNLNILIWDFRCFAWSVSILDVRQCALGRLPQPIVVGPPEPTYILRFIPDYASECPSLNGEFARSLGYAKNCILRISPICTPRALSAGRLWYNFSKALISTQLVHFWTDTGSMASWNNM